MSTRQLKPSTMVWWGRRRWAIERWFKTAKHRFNLHRFGQKTALGIHRWLVLSLLVFLLALYGHWLSKGEEHPDWGLAARTILETFFPAVLLQALLREIERLQPLARRHGLDIQVLNCRA
ncbi:transposase [Microcystis aeruginosa]|uniref:transposase n=1 Tax=Microcystis aeruginosa TaxID=1126 RepID=UPI001558E660|nr:transposase [Microcystis aeruginosa]